MNGAEERSEPGPPGQFDWGIKQIVAELRTIRDASLVTRQRTNRPVKLPAREALANMIEGLRAALFPHRLSARRLADESVDYFVGHTLDKQLTELQVQVAREFELDSAAPLSPGAADERAVTLVRTFARRLPHIRELLESDIEAAHQASPAARTIDEVLAIYPGLTAITYYRFAHELYSLGAALVARVIAEIAHSRTGVVIDPAARIGSALFINHGPGVVIGSTAWLGDHVRLDHGVTITDSPDAAAANVTASFPRIEDRVTIHAWATVQGRITVGQGAVVGPNVWLTAAREASETGATAPAIVSRPPGASVRFDQPTVTGAEPPPSLLRRNSTVAP